MKHRMKLVSMMMTLAILFVASSMTFASGALVPIGVNGEVKILSKPEGNSGIVKIWYSYTPNTTCPQCSSLTFNATTEGGLVLNGPTEWTVPVSINKPHEGILELIVPEDTISKLVIHNDAPCKAGMILYYFVSTGDSIEIHNGKIRAVDQRSPEKKRGDLIRSVLSDKQLDYEYDIKIWLIIQDPNYLSKALSIASPLTPTEREGVFTAKVTKRGYLELREWGYGVNIISVEYPDVQMILDSLTRERAKTLPPSRDIIPQKKLYPRGVSDSLRQIIDSIRQNRGNDSMNGGSALPRDPAMPYNGLIILDHVEGETDNGGISAGEPITFYLTIWNNTSYSIAGMTNGFRVYSPDGVNWQSTAGDTLGSIAWKPTFDLVQSIGYFSANGSGADTVGFGFAVMFGDGLPPGYYDTALAITIGPISNSYIGGTICIDSCYFPPSGKWLWSVKNGPSYTPYWDNPHCFEIEAPPKLEVSGNLGYVDPVPPTNNVVLLPKTLIMMLDYDVSSGSSETLDQIQADEYGFFEFLPVDNTDIGGGGGQDIYFKVYSVSDTAVVLSDYLGTYLEWHSDTIWDIGTGIQDIDVTIPADSAGPFFLLNNVRKSFFAWKALSPVNDTGKIKLVLNKTCITGYDESLDIICINDSTDLPSQQSDAFTEWVLHHEYGHRIAFEHGFFDDTITIDHWMDSIGTPEVAAKEGWAHFWSCYVMDTSYRVEYWDNFTDSFWVDFENGEKSYTNYASSSVNAMGLGNEGAVAGILWDIYDQPDDDYSGLQDYYSLSLPHNPDLIGDDLFLGIADIVDVLTTRKVNGHHPDNMDEFWQCWFDPDSKYIHQQHMQDIFYEHGDSTKMSCCFGVTGNINGDDDEIVAIDDLVYLVEYMFGNGPPPPCMKEADTNGSGAGPDISDLVYLVTYMFSGGPDLYPCQ